MRIIFVRHGETREGKRDIILGSLNGHLTNEGKEEARELAQELKNNNILPDVIVTSPLKRALDTATILSKKLNVGVLENALIQERNAGIAEGKKESEIDWKIYKQKPIERRAHKGGETFLQVQKRAQKFIRQIQKNKRNKNILVVSHDVFILMCIAIIKNKSIAYILKNRPRKKIIQIQI